MNLNLPAGGEYVVIPLAYFEHLLRSRALHTPPPAPEPEIPVPVVPPAPASNGLPKGFQPTSPERLRRLQALAEGADNGENKA